MWECEVCKRKFKNINQHHFCIQKINTIDEYIINQDLAVQEILNKVRSTLKEGLPQAQERISWQMPTFWQEKNIIHFAAFKRHLGVYPGIEVIKIFENELKNYKTNKGTIQFPYIKPIPYDLIVKIAKWNLENR